MPLIYNARIYVSGEQDNTWMVWDENSGYITGIGTGEPPLADLASGDRHDCRGRRVLPGLQESHVHVSQIARVQQGISFRGCGSIQQFYGRIEARLKSRPEIGNGTWLLGYGWQQDLMGRYPTIDDVDRICGNNPLLASRVCGIVALVNSTALALAGRCIRKFLPAC